MTALIRRVLPAFGDFCVPSFPTGIGNKNYVYLVVDINPKEDIITAVWSRDQKRREITFTRSLYIRTDRHGVPC